MKRKSSSVNRVPQMKKQNQHDAGASGGGPVLACLAFNSSFGEATVAVDHPKTCTLMYDQNRPTLGSVKRLQGLQWHVLVRNPHGHGASTRDGEIEIHALALAETRAYLTIVAMHTAVTNAQGHLFVAQALHDERLKTRIRGASKHQQSAPHAPEHQVRKYRRSHGTRRGEGGGGARGKGQGEKHVRTGPENVKVAARARRRRWSWADWYGPRSPGRLSCSSRRPPRR